MQAEVSNQRYLQQNHITAVAFSHSAEYVAIAIKKTHTIRVYKVAKLKQVDSWEFVQQLKQHTQTVSSVDWAKDDKIITVSHDRSGVVWSKAGPKWQKMMVNIDIKLSILTAKWAPNNKKFALGSSCQTLAIGFFNQQVKSWTVLTKSKLVKSPITSLSFHPSSNIIAVGSADYSVKVVSCSFRKSKEDSILKSDIEDTTYNGPFKGVQTLFQVLMTIEDAGGWVNHVSFESNGDNLLVLPHSNHFKFYEIKQAGNTIQFKEKDVKWKGLPFLSGYVNDHGCIVAAGYDKKVAIFKPDNGSFQFSTYCEKNEKSNTQGPKRGLVSGMKVGIQKRSTLYGDPPEQSQHVNAIKVVRVSNRDSPISYDINGVIHFWQ